MLTEFKSFISRGNVVDLAVGIIIGAAFTSIVNSLVADIVMPVLGWLMHGLDFSNYFYALNGQEYASLKAAKDGGAPVVAYGQFLNFVINFFIVSFVIFLVVRQVNRHRRAADAAPTPSETLLREIRDLLKTK
jgi:large conductance mechanosensitive channel